MLPISDKILGEPIASGLPKLKKLFMFFTAKLLAEAGKISEPALTKLLESSTPNEEAPTDALLSPVGKGHQK